MLILNQQGLNIGGGGGVTSQIKVRLRPHGQDSTFLPYESLLGTMLHELVHNVRGPHDAVFYKLLDEITEVCPMACCCTLTRTSNNHTHYSS